ncbi:uncharacterized protein LOC115959546 isoform X1 [Quercus lobata]|uniref:Uncharacterized protein n=1 Tax=Quercus lobata TaxID=97700 RepID=A0A7N2MGN8_QUELO|nr:uncharacterized protein LOC115959546 isoform X1 [Quercus lobata]
MAIGKKKLMSSAPWRGEEEAAEEFQGAKLKVTKQQPGADSVMHVPCKKKDKSKRQDHDNYDDDSLVEIDPQLRYSFQRNYQFLQRVFSIDTIVKPLSPAMAYNVSRNLNFFTHNSFNQKV